MTQLYRLQISSLSLEQAWSALEEAGIEILYGFEEEGCTYCHAYLSSLDSIQPFNWIDSASPSELPLIDWYAQWKDHGHHFYEGCVHIGSEFLGRDASPLRILPGAGFGDLSHPTTRLLLKFLVQTTNYKTVFDIGCGSGILAISAAALGCDKAYGIDIDPLAIDHSRKNAQLNQLSEKCMFFLSKDFSMSLPSQGFLILMNMIRSEQEAAWKSLPFRQAQQGECLTSGILAEERNAYLDQTTRWGWTLLEEREESGWLAFHFKWENLYD